MIEHIGKFRLEKKLGEGATSVVYLGHDDFADKSVAIKIARKELFDDQSVTQANNLQNMLINEVSLAGKLKHPHIVAIHDAGLEDDLLYIVMDYVNGMTLNNLIQSEKKPQLDELISIFFKCCNALGYASEHGIIHRDIKPDNIMLVEKYLGGYNVKVTDFGAALSTRGMKKIEEGKVVGTPAYLSPEMVQGLSVDQRSDIYSFGVIMYQAFTGRYPYTAKNLNDLMNMILKEPINPIQSYYSELPDTYISIVEKCLKKNPEERYQSWDELEHELISSRSALHGNENGHEDIEDASDLEKFVMLKNLKFFNQVSDRKLWEVLSICYWYQLPSEEVIVQDGAKGNTLYILVEGRLRIEKNGVSLGKIQPGYVIGEVAFVQGIEQVRTATVISETEVVIIEIEPEDIEKASDSLKSAFQEILLKVLAERLDRVSKLASSNQNQ
jgi:serine/threonine protein kinase